MTTCSIKGCKTEARTRGMCNKHYLRLLRHGDPRVRLTAESGVGAINGKGYRIITVNGVRRREHEVIVERAMGKPLRKGAEIHHFNGRRSDNRNGNLVVCASRAYHQLLHMRQNALEACGNADWRRCSYCDQYDDPARLKADGFRNFHPTCRAASQHQYYVARRGRESCRT